MASQLILSELEKGHTQDIDKEVLQYLAPVLNEESDQDVKPYGLFAVKFLHCTVATMQSGVITSSLLTAVDVCYRCYDKIKAKIKLTEPLSVQKLLYHILNKLNNKEYLDSVCSISNFLYEELLPLPDISTGTAVTIVSSAFTLLWNLSIKVEQEKDFVDFHKTLKIRYTALKIMLLKKNSTTTVLEKFLLSITRYDKMLSQSKEMQLKGNRHATFDLSYNIIRDILENSTEVGDLRRNLTETDLAGIVSVFQYLVKSVLQHKMYCEMDSLVKNFDNLCTKLRNQKQVICKVKLIEMIYRLLFMCMNVEQNLEEHIGCDILSLSENVFSVCKEIKDISLCWQLMISDIILVFLKFMEPRNITAFKNLTVLLEVFISVINLLMNQNQNKQKNLKLGCKLKGDNSPSTKRDISKSGEDKDEGSLCVKMVSVLGFYLKIVYKFLQQCKDPDVRTKYLEGARQTMETYVCLLDTEYPVSCVDMLDKERHFCGYLMSRYGHFCLGLELTMETVYFYTKACQQLTKWVESDENLKKTRILEVSLGRSYECLADVQRKNGFWQAAQETVAKCLSVDTSLEHTAVKFWVRMKKEGIKQDITDLTTRCADPEVSKCTLAEVAQKVTPGVDVHKLLTLELHHLQSSRKRFYEAEFLILTKLCDTAKTALQKAEASCGLGRHIWLTNTESSRTPKDYFLEAEEALEKCLDPCGQVLRGEICLWLYILHHEDACNKLIKSLPKALEADIAKPGEESDNSSPVITDSTFSFAMEIKMMTKLDQAVELWEVYLCSGIGKENLALQRSLQESMMFCANLYRIAGKFDKEHVVLSLLVQYHSLLGSDVPSTILCRLSDIYLQAGMYDAASKILPELPDSNLLPTFDESYVQLIITKAKHCLATNQIDEGMTLLHTILDTVSSQQDRNCSVFLCDGTVRRMISVYLAIPGSHTETNLTYGYSLELALDAVRSHTGVTQFLLGEKSWLSEKQKGVKSLDKWKVLQEFLESLLHLGRLYRLVGEAREAKCYLKEGWETSHFMGFPKWTTDFLHELTKIHTLSDNPEAIVVCLNDLTRIYQLGNRCLEDTGAEKANEQRNAVKRTVKDGTGKKARLSGEKLTVKKGKGKKTKTTSDDCFGFSDEEQCEIGEVERDDSEQETIHISCFGHMTDGKSCDLCSDPSVRICLLSTGITMIDSRTFGDHVADIDISSMVDKSKFHCKKRNIHRKKFDESWLTLVDLNYTSSPKLTEIVIENLTMQAEIHLQDGEVSKCRQDIKEAIDLLESVKFSSQDVNFLYCRLLLCQAQILYKDLKITVIAKESRNALEADTCTSLFSGSENSKINYLGCAKGGESDSKKETDDVTESLANLNITSDSREKSAGRQKGKRGCSVKETDICKKSQNIYHCSKTVESPQEDDLNDKPERDLYETKDEDFNEVNLIAAEIGNMKISRTRRKLADSKREKEEEKPQQAKASNRNKMCSNVIESSAISTSQMGSPSGNKIESVLMTPQVKCKLSIKTPHSVSSRKAALDLLLDSSDDEVLTAKKRGRGRCRAKNSQTIGKPAKKLTNVKFKDMEENKSGLKEAPCMNLTGRITTEIHSELDNQGHNCITASSKFQDEASVQTQKTAGRSRIPRLMNKTNQMSDKESMVVRKQGDDNSRNVKKDKKITTGKNVRSNVKVASSRSRRQTPAADIECERECDQSSDTDDKHFKTDIYNFDEIDVLDVESGNGDIRQNSQKQKADCYNKENKKVSRSKSTRAASSKNKKGKGHITMDNQERARSEEYEGDQMEKKFSLDVSLENDFELDQQLSDEEMDSSDAMSLGLSYADLQSPHFVDYTFNGDLMKENIELYQHDDSIEIPRGGSEKKSVVKKVQNKRCKKVTSQEKVENEEPDVGTDHVSIISTLEKAYSCTKHFPVVGLHTSLCNMLALLYVDVCQLKAAFYMTEAMAVTFRHQSLINYSKKIRKSKKSDVTPSKNDLQMDNPTSCTGERSSEALQENDVKRLQEMHSELLFQQKPEDLRSMMSSIPEGWTVCQISLVENPQSKSQIILSRLTNDVEPVVVNLPSFASVQGREVLSEFSAIVTASHDSMKVTEKNEWWTKRIQLNDRLNGVLENLEKHWLSHWKCLMYGSPLMTKQEKKKLQNLTDSISADLYKMAAVNVNTVKLQCILQASHVMSDQQLSNAVSDVIGPNMGSNLKDLTSQIRRETSKLTFLMADAKRNHVVLILDKNLQHLPWESMPMLRSASVSRVSSLYHLCTQLTHLHSQKSCVFQAGIDSGSVYYILNPDNNLASTQETFQDQFTRKKNWDGIINNQPTIEQYKTALVQRDLLLYCGHGSGSKYFQGDDLAKLQCRAAAILMGCSSGKLKAKGKLEASGMMLNYFLSGCPCVVANLWDVTDKDIDRFLENLLSTWMSSDSAKSSGDPRFLSEFIPAARNACRLPYLIGAAPVIYGFPVFLKSS